MTDELGLVTLKDPTSPASEAYRTLRTNLQFAALDEAMQTILVTSPGPGEGKSTTLANLAVTMAQMEQRVVAVDADMRRPFLHRLFNLSNEVGLTTMMVDDQVLENPPLLETGVKYLRLLPSGPPPPRPSDLLGSRRMLKVIERLLADADVVLFDAPPVMAVTDAVVLSTRVDGVLLVVSAGETKRDSAQQAVERLKKVNARLLGAVLNNVAQDAAMNSYYR
ncbi:MAG: CpsD/CapB family tyrosine-protein kinase [Anaerolineae bacterium]